MIFWKGLTVQVTHPTENLRAAAEVTRWQHETDRYADESKAIVVSLWRSWEIYDPRLRFRVRTAEELEAVIAEAKTEGKELYVVVGHKGLAQDLNADILALLADTERFEELDTLWAPEFFLTLFPYRCFRGRPRNLPATGIDKWLHPSHPACLWTKSELESSAWEIWAGHTVRIFATVR
ncbi:MAG: hypothetical protein O3C21_20630 [Verrucomicrobia bacterium]|nr:hypothetical protein [Verrucomicrobiota bacterium]